ncbi:MAG TPA: hypothetical protein VMB85_17355 [Bryobacteraceae bacterium]|jgi:hypothetical protein|nr:hypothetical protein [Bryobacteraceae bacterium]
MKTLRCAFFAVILAASASAATVNQALLNLVMPDTAILSGVQVDQMSSSPFGQYLLSQFQPASGGFLQFVGATGFDPRYDLQYILAATSVESTGKQGLVLGVGTFVPSKITAAATAQGATVSQYNGATILTSPGKNAGGTPPALAFLDNQTIAVGPLPLVQGAIDRKNSGAVFSGALATQATNAAGSYQAWFATATPLSDFLNGKAGNLGNLSSNNLFQSIQQSSGGVNLNSSGVTVTADLTTASPQNAQSVVDVLQFLLSMAQNNQNANNKLNTLSGATTFGVNGSTAHVVLALSEQQAEQLVTPPAKSDARPPHQPGQRRQ